MKDFGKKCSVLLTMGLAAFLMTGVSADAMEDAYRVPSLSGPTETWVYQGESFESSRNRVFADDQEDGDLTTKIVKSGNVDTSKPGEYKVTYQVTDSDGKTAQLLTEVKVLNRNDTSESKNIKRVLYTLPDASHLTNIGFNRGYYHDRQSLGIWVPAGKTLTIRLANGEEFKKDLELTFMNNDSATENMSTIYEKEGEETYISDPASIITIPSNGEWTTVKNRYVNEDGTEGSADSVPFIITPKDTTVRPVIEIQWSDDLKEIPYYRYGDDEKEFFATWDASKAPYAIVEGDAATFLVPIVDRDRIIDYPDPNKREEYKFKTIDEMLEWYAAFVKQYDAYSGLDFDASEPCNQNIRAKFFIKVNYHGAGAAYYSPDHSAMNADKNEGGYNSDGSLFGYLTRDWLSLHEFGHGYEGNLALQEHPFVETTNNIMAYYFEPTYRPEDDFGWLLGEGSGATEESKVQRFNALGKKAEDRRNATLTFSGIVEGAQHYDVSLFMFTNMLDKLGPQKTTAAMHTQFRKYFYENKKAASSSNVITESFTRAGGYNVVPYFDAWHIQPSDKVKSDIYDLDYPMVYYLKNLVPDEKECEAIRSKLGLSSIYGLVSTDELADTGYKSKVSIKIKIDDFSVIKGKNILIKNGTKVVKQIPITAEEIETELPVGIYEVELPVPNTASYHYGKEYLIASKGSASAEYEYEKQINPLVDDMQIKITGISEKSVASISLNSAKNTLTWKLESGMPHFYYEDVYLSVRVLDPSGKEIFSQSLKGNQEAEELVKEISFPEGSKLEINHQEAAGRLKAVSNYTGNSISCYEPVLGETKITYVMTEKGLMREDWDEEERMSAYLEVLNSYSEYFMKYVTQSDISESEKYYNEKVTMGMAYKMLDTESKKEYESAYGVLLGKEPDFYAGYAKIDSSKLTGSADSDQGGSEAASYAVDGNESTIWHSNYTGGIQPDISGGKNNSYTILLDKNTDIGRLEYVPRKGGGNGVILSYSISYSTTADGDDFQELKIRNNNWEDNDSTKSVEFDAPNARRIRIRALSTEGISKNTYISAAEFYLYEKYKIYNKSTFLSDLYLETSGAAVKKDTNADGQPVSLYVNGQKETFEKGLGMAAGAAAVIDLTGKNFDVFSAVAGVEAAQTAGDKAVFKIYGDGKLLYQSDTLCGGDSAVSVYLDIRGIKKLELKAEGISGKALVSLGNAVFKSSRDLTEVTLKKGESAAILSNTSLIPQDRGKITWTSSNEAAAVVSIDGVVTAVEEGKAVISGAYEGGTVTCSVNVVKIPENSQNTETTPKPDENGTVVKPPVQLPDNSQKLPEIKVTKPKKVVLKKVKPGKKQAVVYWKKTAEADGYEVWMKAQKGSFKKVKTLKAKKLSVKIKKLKKGKKYTFKVRAYKKGVSNKKVYGVFSKKKTVKIK